MIQRAVRFSVSLARSIIAVGVEGRRRSVFFVTVIDCFPNLAFFEASRLEQTDFLRDSRAKSIKSPLRVDLSSFDHCSN